MGRPNTEGVLEESHAREKERENGREGQNDSL